MRALLALLLALTPIPVLAQDWRAQLLPSAPAGLFSQSCPPAPSGLPDGCVVRGSRGIAAAWYTAPTGRYGHAILGDAIEAGAVTARLADGALMTLVLPDDQVFEDRTPRLADLDGDGRDELVTIRSSIRLGGSVAVYGVRDGALVEIAATAFIGRTNRWLNIAGIADFLGAGALQIAFVETPHIGGTLKLAGFDGRSLNILAQAGDFSNHEIFSREQRLAAIADLDGDGRLDLALPDARRSALRLVRFAPGRISQIAAIALPSPVTAPVLAQGSGASTRLVTGLADGTIVQISR